MKVVIWIMMIIMLIGFIDALGNAISKVRPKEERLVDIAISSIIFLMMCFVKIYGLI